MISYLKRYISIILGARYEILANVNYAYIENFVRHQGFMKK